MDSTSMIPSWIPTTSCSLSIAVAYFSLSHLKHPYTSAVFPAFALFTLAAWYSANTFTVNSTVNLMFAQYQLIFLVHHAWLHFGVERKDLLNERTQWQLRHLRHQRVPYDALNNKTETKPIMNDSKKGSNKNHTSLDWMFAYKLLFNGRCIGTRWEVRRSSTLRDAQGKAATSRSSFIWQCLLSLLIRYAIICVMYDPLVHFRLPSSATPDQSDYDPSKRYLHLLLLSPETSAAVLSRALVLRVHWFLYTVVDEYLVLSSFYDMFAILFVGLLRLDSPQEWPPLFGSIRKAYSIRRYWAEYWQLLIYRSFGSFAGKVAIRLRGRRDGVSRLLHNALVLLASGVMHVMIDWVHTDGTCSRCGCWGSFWWFVLQFLGMLIETAFCAVARQLLKTYTGIGSFGVVMQRVIGYAWVLMWMNFTIEATRFPWQDCILSQ
jgi:hypothetical protein